MRYSVAEAIELGQCQSICKYSSNKFIVKYNCRYQELNGKSNNNIHQLQYQADVMAFVNYIIGVLRRCSSQIGLFVNSLAYNIIRLTLRR